MLVVSFQPIDAWKCPLEHEYVHAGDVSLHRPTAFS